MRWSISPKFNLTPTLSKETPPKSSPRGRTWTLYSNLDVSLSFGEGRGEVLRGGFRRGFCEEDRVEFFSQFQNIPILSL